MAEKMRLTITGWKEQQSVVQADADPCQKIFKLNTISSQNVGNSTSSTVSWLTWNGMGS
jgi:hypothetical protein